jgi:hypothetical protein
MMKYYLLNADGVLWLRYRFVKDHEVGCPFLAREGCGSWCPLFEVFPVTDGTRRRLKHVKLHCGAGTRVIQIEEAKHD